MSRYRALGLLALGAASVLQAQPASIPSHPYRPGIDVLHYELTFDLPDSGRNIEGYARLAVRRSPGTDTLVLDLLSMRVDSVLVNGARISFERDERTLRIPLASAASDSLLVAVRYRGEPLDGLIIGDDSLGRWMAFGDNFPDRGRNWIPSVDHPSDKATVTWIVRAPSERRVVANGVLLEETPLPPGASGRARTLTRWRTTRPIPVYLMVLAAAPLAYYDLGRTACGLSETPGCVPQAVYVSPEVRDYLPGPFARAAEIVEYFSRLVGPYPYEKLAHLQSSTRFGGMENASAIFYSDRAFRRRSLRPGLIAHEAAHQWFGDAVTEREWGHIWLSEGFASYFEQLWVERFTGDSAFRDGMTRLREQIIASAITRERPVIDTAQTEYLKLLNTNSYQKGAWTLHMLRGLIGDSAFFGGIRAYYEKYRHGTALTDDLRREMERTSRMELGWFFDQWLRRPGFADVAVTWRHDPRTKRIVATVRQTGDFLPYRFPLAVDVTDAAGRTSRLTVTVPAERETRLVLPLALSAAPKSVVLDANVGVLARIVIGK